jgi:predicted PolB exonuclease-like 3'-5' exonuclease
MDSLNEKFFNDFTNCNEKIATIQQLIENKFDKNDNFFNQKNFNLPILSLASNINKCEFENEYLFTSITYNDELILDNK